MLRQDPRILSENKAIEVRPPQLKITARKNQVDLEAILACLDYLSQDDLEVVEVSATQLTLENMLSLLVTSVFLKLRQLEDHISQYCSAQIATHNIVVVLRAAVQAGNKALQHNCYVWIKQLLLYRLGVTSRPSFLESEDRNLEFATPMLKFLSDSVTLDVFKDKAQASLEATASYHVSAKQIPQNCYSLM